jgi:hypothetical protein
LRAAAHPLPVESLHMNKKVGLYGFVSHAVIVLAFVMSRSLRGERLGNDLLLVGVPLLFLSSFLIYAFIVSRYVLRREGIQKPVIIDSLVGILSEYMIFTLAAVLFGIYDGLRGGPGAGAGIGRALLTSVFMNILWVYATFMVQIIVIGNVCGLVGWYLLRKKQPGR